jgi:hypothetical protein
MAKHGLYYAASILIVVNITSNWHLILAPKEYGAKLILISNLGRESMHE